MTTQKQSSTHAEDQPLYYELTEFSMDGRSEQEAEVMELLVNYCETYHGDIFDALAAMKHCIAHLEHQLRHAEQSQH